MKEIVKPEGIKETDDYDAYDQSVQDLMDVMQSVVSTSLSYNDLLTVRLLTLKFSFYGIITLGVDLDFVGQIGILQPSVWKSSLQTANASVSNTIS